MSFFGGSQHYYTAASLRLHRHIIERLVGKNNARVHAHTRVTERGVYVCMQAYRSESEVEKRTCVANVKSAGEIQHIEMDESECVCIHKKRGPKKALFKTNLSSIM